MHNRYISTITAAGDAGVLLSPDSMAILVHELESSGWRRVHNAPGTLVAYVNHDALYCHIAWDGRGRPVAWTSH